MNEPAIYSRFTAGMILHFWLFIKCPEKKNADMSYLTKEFSKKSPEKSCMVSYGDIALFKIFPSRLDSFFL
jgi:hypothetical protein